VAVRHAEDHIHIAAVLVRQDTGRRFWPHHDYPKLRTTARRIEQRLGLRVTAAPDGTVAPRPSRGEMEKAGRRGGVPARVELRRAAQQAAVAATDVDGFVAYLQERGYRVGLRRAPSGDLIITGLSAEIAQTLVAIGADISKLNTAGDLQGGIEQAERLLGLTLIRIADATS
jgi:hypothetical protein